MFKLFLQVLIVHGGDKILKFATLKNKTLIQFLAEALALVVSFSNYI